MCFYGDFKLHSCATFTDLKVIIYDKVLAFLG